MFSKEADKEKDKKKSNTNAQKKTKPNKPKAEEKEKEPAAKGFDVEEKRPEPKGKKKGKVGDKLTDEQYYSILGRKNNIYNWPDKVRKVFDLLTDKEIVELANFLVNYYKCPGVIGGEVNEEAGKGVEAYSKGGRAIWKIAQPKLWELMVEVCSEENIKEDEIPERVFSWGTMAQQEKIINAIGGIWEAIAKTQEPNIKKMKTSRIWGKLMKPKALVQKMKGDLEAFLEYIRDTPVDFKDIDDNDEILQLFFFNPRSLLEDVTFRKTQTYSDEMKDAVKDLMDTIHITGKIHGFMIPNRKNFTAFQIFDPEDGLFARWNRYINSALVALKRRRTGSSGGREKIDWSDGANTSVLITWMKKDKTPLVESKGKEEAKSEKKETKADDAKEDEEQEGGEEENEPETTEN